MRLIDADSLKEKFSNLHGEGDTLDNMYGASSNSGGWAWYDPEDYGIDACEKVLNEEPTIDAEQVVRCKECKYAHLTFDGLCKYCDIISEYSDGNSTKLYFDGNHFCSDGERK